MSRNGTNQPEASLCQQRVATLEAELAQARSHLEILLQENEHLASQCERLQKAELRYRQIFENAPISILAISTEGIPVEMNRAAEAFIGWTIAEAREANFNVLVEPNLVENGTVTSVQRAIAGETIIEPPMYYNPLDQAIGNGQWRWAQGHYYPIRNQAGEVQEVVEIAIDLTEMYQVQQQLSQERTQLLSMVAQVANLLLKSSNYTSVFPDVVRLLGEAVGSDRCGIGQKIIHPTSRKPAARIVSEWCKTAIRSSEEFSPHADRLFLWEHDAPFISQQLEQGKVINCLVNDLPEADRSLLAAQGNTAELFVPILIHHRFWGFIAFDNCREARLYDEAEVAILKIAADSIAAALERQVKDDELRKAQEDSLQAEQERSQELERINTELQQALARLTESEQRYRQLMELANEGIFRLEYEQPIPVNLPVEEQAKQIYQQFRYAEHNVAFAQMYGYDQPNALVGTKLAHVMDAPENAVRMEQFVRNGHQMRNQETVELDRFGRKRYFLNNGFSIIRDGYAIGGWGTQIDITELRETQQALLEAEQARTRSAAERSKELEHLNVELVKAIDRLQTRDRLLEVTAMAANALLTLDDFDEAMNTTLKILGEALQTNRVKVLEHCFEDKSSLFPTYSAVTYEWVTPGTVSQMTHPTSSQIDARDADRAFMQQVLYNGFGGLLHEWDRSLWDAFEAVQAKAIYCVPIWVQDQIWGAFIFDDCHEVKQRSPIEMAILKIGANCIGSAIERKRSQQSLLEAEQQRVAELAKTNQALKNSLDRLAASPDLNAFLGYILLEIVKKFNLDLANLYLYDLATETLSLKLQIQDQQVTLKPQIKAFDALLHCSTRNSPIWHILLETKRPLVCDCKTGQECFSPSTFGHRPDESSFQIEVHLLLTLGDEPIGLVSLGSTQRTAFTPQELELTQALIHQATLAIQLTRLAEEARQTSLLQERNRIAQDIHDTLAQAFGGILIQLQATQYFLKRNPDKAFEQFNVAIALAREGLAEARRSVWTLYDRSADYQSLEVALPQLAERLTKGNAAQVTVTIEGTPHRLDPEVGQNLLRLAQEALNNALRHAHAQTIRLTLFYESDRLSLTIQDDGHGFDPNQPINGFGISNMKQRAEYLGSTLNLISQPGVGTEVAIAISTVASNSRSASLANYLPLEGASKLQLPD